MELTELVMDQKEIIHKLQNVLGIGYRVSGSGLDGILVEIKHGESFIPLASVALPANDFQRIAVSEGPAIRDAKGPIRIVRGSIYVEIVKELMSMQLGPVDHIKQPVDSTYCPN